MPSIRVQLVCDHQMLADALGERLTREPDEFLVSHVRSTDTSLLRNARAHRPDVVVIDAGSMAAHWSTLVDGVAEAAPEARVVVLSATTDAEDAVRAARRRVSAWVLPQTTAAHVIDILRVVVDAHTVYPSTVLGVVLQRLVDELGDPGVASGPLATLTDRERDVLACLAAGQRGREIADHLEMAPNTVRSHSTRIFRKLGVHSRLEAVRIAREHGFAPGATVRGSHVAAASGDARTMVLVTGKLRSRAGSRDGPP